MQDAAAHNLRVRVTSAVSVLVGIWLVVSPNVLPPPSGVLARSATVCGILVVICAAIRFIARFTAAASWAILVIAAWIVASPWILDAATGDRRTWSLILSGMILAGMQAYSITTSAFPHRQNEGADVIRSK
jgi:uncharacterized membrane protein YphA (DoxX/SURF4 family)